MNKTEHLFDINKILKKTYLSLKELREKKNIELLFEMGKSIPRELRGNDPIFQQLLVTLLSFVFKNTSEKEILLSLSAPEDFVYEELVSLKIKETHIPKEKVLAFLETGLGNNLELLDGKIIYDHDLDIHLQIPFIIGELGFRRHYRLPSKSMLKKKVLLIFESENVTLSIMNMFKYFPFDVDLGFREFKEDRTKLAEYDLVVIEENLITESFAYQISQIQEDKPLKYVLLGKGKISKDNASAKISTNLIQPVTQESIFELIVSLFELERTFVEKKLTSVKEKKVPAVNIPVPENLQNKTENSLIHKMIEEKRGKEVYILDTKSGLENAKKKGVIYSQELEHFLETFNKSDLYFRQIVNEKQTNKIKDFCIDLEQKSKDIGADSMQKLSDIISLIFVYNKLDMLPIYPGRYHIELMKLEKEIKTYLHIQ